MSATETIADTVWLLAALLGHGVLWVEVVNRSHGLNWARKLIDALTAVSGVLVVGMPIYAVTLALASENPLGVNWFRWYSAGCVVVLLIFGFTRITQRWRDPHRQRPVASFETEVVSLGKKLGAAATGSARLAQIARLPGNQLLKLHVERHEHHLAGLPVEAEGLRIAHLTDLHMSGRLGIEYFREVVRIANAWEPDLVCITGDIVEHTPQLEWIDSTLGELRSQYGTFFVLGNHDLKELDPVELRKRLLDAGLTHLGGQTLEIDLASGTKSPPLNRSDSGAQRSKKIEVAESFGTGSKITLCGDERPWLPAAPPLDDASRFTLALVHTPDRFEWACEQGIDLVLAGHTHGGQVCFPWFGPLLCPSRHGVRYASGLFHHEGTTMHVSRGTGSLFPLRYNCPPELGLLTLRCQS